MVQKGEKWDKSHWFVGRYHNIMILQVKYSLTYVKVWRIDKTKDWVMGQMKIAVCDDIREERELLQKNLEKLWDSAQIDGFETGDQLLERIKEGSRYNLIFIDIFLGKEDGIELGRELRRYQSGAELVYVSNSREFGPEIYELEALHYLLKPYKAGDLEEVKKRYDRIEEKRTSVLHIRIGQKKEVPCHTIAYIESVHNNLVIHLKNGSTLRVRRSLQEYMKELDDRFLRINRGVIVNMEAIDRMNGDSVSVDGMIFMLSRKDRAEKRKRYNDWLFEMVMGGDE